MIQRLDVDGAVIVVGPDAGEVGAAVRDAAERGERVGAMIGSMDDPAFQAALDEMVEELYGLGDSNS
jgi:hypothetical protein